MMDLATCRVKIKGEGRVMLEEKGHRGKRTELYDLDSVIIVQQAGYDVTYSSLLTMCIKGHSVFE